MGRSRVMRARVLVAALAVLATALAECDDGPKGPTVDGVNEARNTGKPNCNNRAEKLEDKDQIWVTAGQHRPNYSDKKVPAGNGKFSDNNKYLADTPPPPDPELAIVTDEKGQPRDVVVTRNADGNPIEPCVYCDTKEAQRRRAAPPGSKGAVNDALSVIPGVNTLTGTKKGKQGPSGQPHESPPWYVIVDPETKQQRLYSASKLDNTCPNGCSGLGKCIKGICYCIKGYHCDDCGCKRCPSDCSGKGLCDLHTGVCKCKLGYVGDACERYDMFAATNCSGHGVANGPDCKCNPGWKGLACDKRTCNGNCNQKNGICDEGKCYCRTGWRGDSCDIRACPKQCSFMGACDSETGKCKCIPGLYGDDCSRGKPLMPPEPSPCEKKTCGHGSCDFVTGECMCAKGWHGYDCSKSECTKTDASGGLIKDCGNGVCKIDMNGEPFCECNAGWKKDGPYGFKCEGMITSCKNNCTAQKVQGVCNNDAGTCKCKDGFAGEDCSQTKARFCSDNCAQTCLSLCVLNPAITSDPNAKIDHGEFGNNVHCLESCNGRCFIDCMAGAKPSEQSLANAAVAKAAHVGEDSDILPSQIARSAKVAQWQGGNGTNGTVSFQPQDPHVRIAQTGVDPHAFSHIQQVDLQAPPNTAGANLQRRISGRVSPSDMPGNPPPASVEN